MFQVDNDSSVTVMPSPTNAGTPGFFTDGNPATGQQATVLSAEFMNMVMMELANLVTSAGLTLSKSDYTQVSQAVKAMIASLATVSWANVTDKPTDLTVAGKSTLTGAVTASSTLSVAGVTTLTGAATLKSTLAVTGGATLSSTLTVAGSASFASTVAVQGEVQAIASKAWRQVNGNYGSFWYNDGSALYLMLTNSGDQYGTYNALRPFSVSLATGSVAIGSNLSLGGTVTVSGAATFSSTLAVTGAVTLGAGLTVAGQAVFNTVPVIAVSGGSSCLMMQGDSGQYRYISFRTGTSSRLDFGINSTAESGTSVGSDVYMNMFDNTGAFLYSPLKIARSTGFTTLMGLTVTGALNASSSVSVATTLAVTGATTLSSTLGVTGAATLSNTLSVSGATTLSSTVAITGAATLSSSLTVATTATVTGATILKSTLTVSSSASFASSVTVSGSLGVAGVATIGSSIELGGQAGTATTPFIDFHAGATVVDYDCRIIASNGTGVVGAGTLNITAASVYVNGDLQASGTISLAGGAAYIATNGDLYGTVWGGLLSSYLASSVVSTTRVETACAGIAVGDVGSYAFLAGGGTAYSPGATAAGSALKYSSADDGSISTTTATGTWRCMGYTSGTGTGKQMTLWLRIA